MKGLPINICALAALAPAWGQVPTDSVGQGDFPALQLLPPGSVIKGISLPRYEKHRVSALLTAKEMEVKTRSVVRLQSIRASLYAASGETTTVCCQTAHYDFKSDEVRSDTAVEVRHPLFTALGQSAQFNTTSGVGMLYGPVRTTISAGALNKKSK